MVKPAKKYYYIGGGILVVFISAYAINKIVAKTMYNRIKAAIDSASLDLAGSGKEIPTSKTSVILKDSTLSAIAHAFHDSIYSGFWHETVDMAGIKAAFDKINSEVQFSQVVNKYAAIFGKDLMTELQNNLSDTHMSQFNTWKKTLPRDITS